MGQYDHATDRDLEEYVFRRFSEDRIETMETHVLGCEFCLVRLEQLELHVATMKLVLRDLQIEETSRATHQRTTWGWFAFPSFLSIATAALVVIAASIPPIIR
jgi:hypothetical protein